MLATKASRCYTAPLECARRTTLHTRLLLSSLITRGIVTRPLSCRRRWAKCVRSASEFSKRGSSTLAPCRGVASEGRDLGQLILRGHKTTTLAHQLWRQVVTPGDLVVDATCGNGHDTLAMALMTLRNCGPAADAATTRRGMGRVIALDLQDQAVESTRALLSQSLTPDELTAVDIIRLCHSQLGECVPESSASLVVFNLGYLPGGEKEMVTKRSTTLRALESATSVVAPGGLISVMAYVGHPEGWEEFESVRDFAASLPATEWVCTLHETLNRVACPRLLLLSRRL
eukprot:TRINITY_DN6643_c0_g1_i1.p1 TRINITY_DN6643_c0_g1~~TRINITY_DN6643_c0_g1_i1.p1  ORF type:complete len:287 (-),score=11.68 TRINITY_DN6643_c0_g1_i1:442-1302(-)